MKKYLLAFVFLLTTVTLSAQNKIEINTKFTLKVTATADGKYTCAIDKQEPFAQTIDTNNTSSLFDKEVPADKIQGVLAFSKSGTGSTAVLVLKSGVSNSLSYSLMVKTDKGNSPTKAPVANLFQNAASIEIWPMKVQYIVFDDFKNM